MHDYFWIPWLIAGSSLLFTVLDKVLSKRSSREEAVERRLQQLEVAAQVDKVKLDGELTRINEKLSTTTSGVNQTRQLLKSLVNESPG